MVHKKDLENYNIADLERIRGHLLMAESKEELLTAIEEIIKMKKDAEEVGLNAQFQIDWMNIDPEYRALLHQNGIHNLAQLKSIDDLSGLNGMTKTAKRQIGWARDFFDLESIQAIPPEERTEINIARVIVKRATKFK